MFRKINQQLITRYPLLWNTKIVFILPALACIHLLFYLAGFLPVIGMDQLYRYRLFNIDDETIFSVLVSAVTILLWLAYYLRNNPLKSHYSVSRNYLFCEFLIIFIVFLSSATFFYSYKQGLYDNVAQKTRTVDLTREADIVNLSYHFLAFDKTDFEIWDCCDSLEAHRIREEATRRKNDSLRKLPGETMANATTEEATYDEEGEYIRTDTTDYPESYLYYCNQGISFPSDSPDTLLLTATQLNQVAQRWLREHRKDSVRQLLDSVVSLCNKYSVKYFFKPEEQVKECFNDSLFTVKNEIYYTSDPISEERNLSQPAYYIELGDVKNALDTISEARDGFWKMEILLTWLYYSLSASILLFTFRITRLRHWFISLIGTGIWMIVVVLLTVLLGLEENVMILLLSMALLFLLYTHSQVVRRASKLVSGVTFNWFVWMLPAVVPLICGVIMFYAKPDCYNYENMDCPPPSAIYTWLRDSWALIGFGNAGLFILVMYFYIIPLARKWQANPEE